MLMAKSFNLRAFIIAGLRRMSYRYPARSEAMKNARVERGLYKCANCLELFGPKQINVDHIEPVVPETGFPILPDGRDDFTTYIYRMFVNSTRLQILCKTCHNIKSNYEKDMRKINRKNGKHRKKKNINVVMFLMLKLFVNAEL